MREHGQARRRCDARLRPANVVLARQDADDLVEDVSRAIAQQIARARAPGCETEDARREEDGRRSTYARQRLAFGLRRAASAESGVQNDRAGPLLDAVADDRGVAARADARAAPRARAVAASGRTPITRLAFVGDVQRIDAEKLARRRAPAS